MSWQVKPFTGGVPKRAAKPKDDPVDKHAREIGALEAGFVARAKAEQARVRAATDSEYYCCLVFQSREQLDAFIRASGFGRVDDRYHDGQVAARIMGIELPPGPDFGKVRIDRSLAHLVRNGEYRPV